MEHKLEVHIQVGISVDVNEQHLTIHSIKFCAVWCISSEVAYDQVDPRSLQVSDVGKTDHRLITIFWPKSSKIVTNHICWFEVQ